MRGSALVACPDVHVEATTAGSIAAGADTIVLGLFAEEPITDDGAGGALAPLVRSGEASTKLGHLSVAHDADRRIIGVGLGQRTEFGPEQSRRAAAAAHGRASELATKVLGWEVPRGAGDEAVKGLVEGTLLHAYRFDRYKPPDTRTAIERLIVSAHTDISEPVREAAVVTAAQNRARDLGNTPGNDLTPAALAEYAQQLASTYDRVAVTGLDEAAIRAAGMGAFAAVAQGSAEDARLIRIEYAGNGSAAGPDVGLIGKGVTFDSGGLSLKPAGSMHELKFDMCGAAAVIEAIAAIAELGLPARVLGVVGATENLPSGTAVKPGDIVRALDGTTIEVDNTDAEGRLVLADCLCYARREGCRRLLDVATLTGGIVVALGSTYAGMMSNDEPWAANVGACAARVGEPVWRMPLHEDYAGMVKGRYAELTNRPERREATALTAAEFLHHFAGDTPWAHLDIAGMAYDVPRPYYVGKGATGFGVRLLVDVARHSTDAAGDSG
jgi:leucyl aminopeptidase